MVIIKDAGHALNVEKPKEMSKQLKSFLVDSLPRPNHESQNNGLKAR